MKIILENNCESVALACQFLREGKVVAFATDTVYGIAVDATNERAVDGLYLIKKRDVKKPIAVFVKNLKIAEQIFCFDKIAKKIAEKFLPGSLTLVLKQRSDSHIKIAKNLNCDAQNFLGFRIVDCDFIARLMAEFDGILAVTSANPSGLESAIRASEVEKYFANSGLSLIVDGGNLSPKNISTVVKIVDQKIEILRHGVVSELLIKQALDHESFQKSAG